MEYFSTSCEIKSYSEIEDSNLLKVRLRIVKTGRNSKNTKFSLEAIKLAEDSLKNIPILAYLKVDEDDKPDFGGHNRVKKIIRTENRIELREEFLERPIGLIPESNNVTYEVDDSGEIYLCCDGYVWKNYANQGLDVITNADKKGISMEIRIREGQYDGSDGCYDIKNFKFLGVTALGDDVRPAIEGAYLTKYENFSIYKDEIEKIVSAIYSIEERSEDMEIEKANQDVEEIQEDGIEESTEEAKNEPIKEVEDSKDESEESTEEEMNDNTEEVKDESAEEVEDSKNESEENTEEAEKEVEDKPLEEEGQFSIFKDLLDSVPIDIEDLYAKMKSKFSEMTKCVMERDVELEKINSELETLRKFKSDIEEQELKSSIEAITSKFSFEEEEISELKEKALAKEISVKDYEKELYCIVGMKIISNKESFSADEKPNVASVDVSDDEDFEQGGRKPIYSDLVEKAKNKKNKNKLGGKK